MVVGHALLVRGASGTIGLLLVVAVLASGEHPKPQPSLDVTCCGLGSWESILAHQMVNKTHIMD